MIVEPYTLTNPQGEVVLTYYRPEDVWKLIELIAVNCDPTDATIKDAELMYECYEKFDKLNR